MSDKGAEISQNTTARGQPGGCNIIQLGPASRRPAPSLKGGGNEGEGKQSLAGEARRGDWCFLSAVDRARYPRRPSRQRPGKRPTPVVCTSGKCLSASPGCLSNDAAGCNAVQTVHGVAGRERHERPGAAGARAGAALSGCLAIEAALCRQPEHQVPARAGEYRGRFPGGGLAGAHEGRPASVHRAAGSHIADGGSEWVLCRLRRHLRHLPVLRAADLPARDRAA